MIFHDLTSFFDQYTLSGGQKGEKQAISLCFAEALFEAGRTKSFDLEFYEIDPHLLDPENTIVYLYKNNKREGKLKENNFAKYNPDDIAQYSAMPIETKDYYKEMYMQGKNPLLFHKIPHILYRGSLDVSKVRKIKV
mgnify:CR=1 FL=1